MLTALVVGGIALWLAVATGVAVGIGRAITTADQQQAAHLAAAALRDAA